MPEVVVTGATNDTPTIGGLFNGKAFFLVQRLPSRADYIAKIKANGGRHVLVEQQADYVIADPLRKDAPHGSTSFKFVDECIKHEDILDAADFPTNRASTTAVRKVGSAVPGKSTRTAFTAADDALLLEWLERGAEDGYSNQGIKIYELLAEKHPHHTTQSWRSRWVKKLSFERPSTAPMVTANAPPSPLHAPDQRESVPPAVRQDSDRPQISRGKKRRLSLDLDSLPPEFDLVDVAKLLQQAEHIENIPAQNKEEAWLSWADVESQHTAGEWQDLWDNYVRAVHLKSAEDAASSGAIRPPKKKRKDITRAKKQAADDVTDLDLAAQAIAQVGTIRHTPLGSSFSAAVHEQTPASLPEDRPVISSADQDNVLNAEENITAQLHEDAAEENARSPRHVDAVQRVSRPPSRQLHVPSNSQIDEVIETNAPWPLSPERRTAEDATSQPERQGKRKRTPSRDATLDQYPLLACQHEPPMSLELGRDGDAEDEDDGDHEVANEGDAAETNTDDAETDQNNDGDESDFNEHRTNQNNAILNDEDEHDDGGDLPQEYGLAYTHSQEYDFANINSQVDVTIASPNSLDEPISTQDHDEPEPRYETAPEMIYREYSPAEIAESSPARYDQGNDQYQAADELDDSSEPDLEQLEALRQAAYETQDVLNAETQAPDFDMLSPPADEELSEEESVAVDNSPTKMRKSRTSTPRVVAFTTKVGDEPGHQDAISWMRAMQEEGYSELSIVRSLKYSSMDPERARLVLVYERQGRGFPSNMPGIWTAEDDRVLDGGDARALRLLEDKHGWEYCEERRTHLEAVREQGRRP